MDNKRILLVEDNAVASKMAYLILSTIGCQVDCVDNGDEAIEMTMKNQYHAICMDIGLPTISGVQACIAIRAYEAKNNLTPVPIVALTANYSDEEIVQYKEAGMQEVIAKPLTKEKAEHFVSFCR